MENSQRDQQGKPKAPADPEGPDWFWISSQVDAPAWITEMEKTLAEAAAKRAYNAKCRETQTDERRNNSRTARTPRTNK